jgi:hypothetical protein
MAYITFLVANVSSVMGRSKKYWQLKWAHLLTCPACLVGPLALLWCSILCLLLTRTLVIVEFLLTNMP